MLINKMGYLKPTCLDLQVLAGKLLPFATIVRLAISFLLIINHMYISDLKIHDVLPHSFKIFLAYPILATQYPILATQYSMLVTCYFILVILHFLLDTCYLILVT